MTISNAALAASFACIAGLASGQSSTATYQLAFDATWSSANHPGAYPGGAHFSQLIGGVHSENVSFWAPGALASPGIELMAETGGTSLLRSEVLDAISGGTASAVVLGAAINSPGSTTLTFEATSSMSRLTLVTMIAPSPDWFIGVHDLELMGASDWAQEIVVPLIAYDAGTDSGPNFTSPNADTNPQDPITDFASTAPFAGLPELGTFTLTLLSVDVCLADANADGALTPADFTAWIAAFNAAAPVCDQNGDNACTPADFTAWIVNYNTGC